MGLVYRPVAAELCFGRGTCNVVDYIMDNDPARLPGVMFCN